MNILYPIKIYSSLESDKTSSLLINTGLQIDVNEPNPVILKPKDYIILDFGKETNGRIRLLTNACFNDSKIRIRYGESYSECSSDVGMQGSTNDHATRDFISFIPHHSDMTFFESGFRFVRIDTVGNTEIRIKSVILMENINEEEQKGSFESDDKLLNQIFNTGAYTVRLCLQNGMIWDGIKRDRLVWIGDMHPETTSLSYLYGDIENIKNSLDHAKKYNPLPLWMNNIPSYSLWWIIIHYDYYMRCGNKEYLLEQLSYLNGLIDQLSESVKEDGKIVFAGGQDDMRYFIDWPTKYSLGDDESKINDSYAGVEALMHIALDRAQKIYSFLDLENNKINVIQNKLNKNRSKVLKSRAMSALRILAGISDKNDEQILKTGGSHNISTFMAGYIFMALSKIGENKLAYNTMLDYYGEMLKKGATTFFEDFDIDWVKGSSRIDEPKKEEEIDFHSSYGKHCYTGFRHSLCHGWSSSFIGYIYKELLGINILEPGSTKVEIKPDTTIIKNATASLPTKYGVIDIKIENAKVIINAPNEVKIIK